MQLFASMSSPSFLFANESNHTLLQSLLEYLNAVIEHQYSSRNFSQVRRDISLTFHLGNPNLVYAIWRSKKRFQSLRNFTLESGQAEIERMNQIRKERGEAEAQNGGIPRGDSMDSLRSPTGSHTPSLSNVPEESGAFAIGDDEESDGEEGIKTPHATSATQSSSTSRAPSVASNADDTVPLQLRGMSEKARGKMPAGQPSFSRQNSTTSLGGIASPVSGGGGMFTPSAGWVSTLTRRRLHSSDSLTAM